MKNKFLLPLVSAALFCSALNVFAAEGIIKDGRTLVPVRGVFEDLGFTVDWNDAESKAVISDGNHDISLIKGMKWFRADGREIFPDVPQQIINGSFYLPLRAIGDAAGADVSWDADSKTATVKYNGRETSVKCKSEQLKSNNAYQELQNRVKALSSDTYIIGEYQANGYTFSVNYYTSFPESDPAKTGVIYTTNRQTGYDEAASYIHLPAGDKNTGKEFVSSNGLYIMSGGPLNGYTIGFNDNEMIVVSEGNLQGIYKKTRAYNPS